MMRTILNGMMILLLSHPCTADVMNVTDMGFESRNAVSVPVGSTASFKSLTKDVAKWWNPDHTFSGNAQNLSMDVSPGGLFSEKLEAGGFVTHMQVIYAAPGKAIRLAGALGPLQEHAITAVLTMTLLERKEGGCKVTWVYRVGGYFPGGLKALAPIVDKVMAEQLNRFQKHVSKRE